MDRKEAVKAFKTRKVPAGIFVIRCRTTGDVWADSTPNLDAARNRTWFQLQGGLHRNKSLQEAWNTHGEQALDFEVVETLDEDLSPMALPDVLRDKKAEWATKIRAQPL